MSLAVDFHQVTFPSRGHELFRATVKTTKDGVALWVESMMTKQQWETIVKLADCGPVGVPEEVLLTFLKVFI
jgi:hypothetical protein